ncbi:hypothetical protein ATO12_06540 [Aquimarina atlantica]|uniref:DUF4249 domain-containing protein n=1 Tax=Aquimarina atlantica TaxID=1317122 RepID=A0A023BPL6_9FLAO|nr:DUF4249 family protein [Aquimarina atlantica]EZH71613.1 hypothetical protein ATO12_06540 [Aquimarina atlantica]
MKSIYIKIITGSLLIFCIISCTKEISLDVTHEPQTIIFGSISNETVPVSIRIQQSVPLQDSSSSKPVNDASVSLYAKDTSGNTNLITNDFAINQGIYTSTQSISTIIGYSYWIEVRLTDGTLFKSKEELLKPVVLIKNTGIKNGDVLEIEFSDPGDDTNFYKFTVELFNEGQLVSSNTSQSNDVVFNGKESASVEVDLFRLQDDDEDITVLYDEIKVTFCNINFSSYQFYLNQSLQLEANDSESSGDPSQLFATPPVNLLGNITNSSSNTVVLGNFTVNSLSTVNQPVSN